MSEDGGAPKAFNDTPGSPGAFSNVVSRALDKVLGLLGASWPAPPSSDPTAAAAPLASHLKPVAWVAETAQGEHGSSGRIMVSWPQNQAIPDAIIQHLPGVFTAPGRTLGPGVALARGHAANDNTVWVGDEDFDGIGGALGRDPTVAVLADGHTVVAWISDDNIVHASVYPPDAGRLVRPAAAHAQALTAERLVLGEASKQNSRLSVAPSDTTGFLVLWATEFGFTAALIAKASLSASEPAIAAEGDVSNSWQTIPLDTVPDGLEQATTVAVVQSGTSFQIAYAVADAAGSEPETETFTIVIPDGQGPIAPPAVETETVRHTGHAAASASSTAYVQFEASEANALPSEVAGSSAPALAPAAAEVGTDAPSDGGMETISGPVELTDNPDGAALPLGEVSPAPAATTKAVVDPVSGQSHQLSVAQGAGPTATLTLSSGGASPQVITDKAIVSDPGNPHIDLAPDLTTVEGKVAVVFVEAAPEGDLKQLSVAVVTPAEGDKPASVQTATVAIADAPDSTISDLSVTGTAAPDGTPDLAILWVSNASNEGYGTITAQLAEIITGPSGPPPSHAAQATGTDVPPAGGADASPVVAQAPSTDLPVALDTPMDSPQVEIAFLGKDCGRDGDDEPFTLGEGRDPEATSLPNESALAVAWIAPPEANDAPEVVKGAVLSLENGEILQELDLSELMPRGCSDGTDLSITADAAGDIILSWLQDAMDGGFNAMAALFVRAAHDRWDEPLSAKQLKHFAEKPLEFTVEVVGGPEISVSLTWTEGDGEHSSPAVELKADLHDGSVTVSILADAAPSVEHGGDNSGSGSSGGDSDHHDAGNSGPGDGNGLTVSMLIVPADSSVAAQESSALPPAENTSGKDGSGPSVPDIQTNSSNSGSGSGSSGGDGDLTPVVVVDLDGDTLYVATATLTQAAEVTSAANPDDANNSGKGGDERIIAPSVNGEQDAHSGSSGKDDDGSGNDGLHGGNSGSGGHAELEDGDVAADCFVYAAGYGHDAPVPDLVLTSSGEIFVEDATPFDVALGFDMALSEDVFLFDDHGQPTLQHSAGWHNDLALI